MEIYPKPPSVMPPYSPDLPEPSEADQIGILLNSPVFVESYPIIVPEVDDTGRINRCIQANPGRLIFFQKPLYKISSQIEITHSGTKLMGSGKTELSDGSGGTCILNQSTTAGDAFYIHDCSHVTITAMGIYGNNQSGYGLHVVNLASLELYDVFIGHHGKHGVYLVNSIVTQIFGGKISFNQMDGVNADTTSNALRIIGTRMGANVNYAVNFNAQSGTFLGLTIESNKRGIVIGSSGQLSRGITVHGCYFENTTEYDIWLSNATAFDLSGNYHYGNGTGADNTIAPIRLDNAYTGKIASNVGWNYRNNDALAIDYANAVYATGITFENNNFNGSLGLANAPHAVALQAGIATLDTINVRNATATTVGAAGTAAALPAAPVGYATIQINGTNYKVPYYNV